MPSPLECIRLKAGAGKISPKKIKEANEILTEMRSAGDDVSKAVDLRDYMVESLRKQKQQVAYQIRTIQGLERTAADAEALDIRKVVIIPAAKVSGKTITPEWSVSKMTMAMLSRLTMDPTGTFRGANVEITWKRIRGEAEGIFSAGLERFHRSHLGFRQDRQGLRDFLRELYDEASGNKGISEIAKSWRVTDDFLVRKLREAGAHVNRNKYWGFPQSHNPQLLAQSSFTEWADFIIPLLDRKKMIDNATNKPFTDKGLEAVLPSVYETLRTGGLSKLVPGGPRIGRKLSNRHSEARFLLFKDSESWFVYDGRYGTKGDIFEIMVGHIDQMSREIALLQNLGPNPKATINWMQDTIRKHQAELAVSGKEVPEDSAGALLIERTYDVLSGNLNNPAAGRTAETFQSIRNYLTSAQLTGALISALTDVNYARMTSNFNGLNAIRQQKILMKTFFGMLRKKESLKLAAKLQLGAEQWAGTAIAQSRYMSEISGSRISKMVSDSVLRATLLSPWTVAGRASFKQEILMSIADRMGRLFDELEPEFRRALERHNIDAAQWDNIRNPSNFLDEGGQKFFWSEQASRNGFGGEASRIMDWVFTETEYAIPSSTALTQLAVTGGTKSGTFYGEMIRNVGLYKSFPMTVILTHLARNVTYAGTTKTSKLKSMLDLIISTTILGGMVTQTKQILGGKDPISVFNMDHGLQFWAAAMLQGGGLGIFGDFLFADLNRFGYGPLNTLAGPVLGSFVPDTLKLTIGNLQEVLYGEDTKIGREVVQYLKNYTPMMKAWYGRIAMERLLFDRLQDIMDPNASRSFQQKRQRAQTNFGQDWWWAPGKTSPERRPDLGAIIK